MVGMPPLRKSVACMGKQNQVVKVVALHPFGSVMSGGLTAVRVRASSCGVSERLEIPQELEPRRKRYRCNV